MDDVGSQLAMRYGARGVPTFVLLDGTGQVVYKQTGIPDREKIEALVADLSSR